MANGGKLGNVGGGASGIYMLCVFALIAIQGFAQFRDPPCEYMSDGSKDPDYGDKKKKYDSNTALFASLTNICMAIGAVVHFSTTMLIYDKLNPG